MLVCTFFIVVCAWATGSAVKSGQLEEPADKSTFRVDYRYYPNAGGWLKLHSMPAKWLEARQTCFLEGALLASPITEGLSLELRNLAQEAKLSTFHTGIHSQSSVEDFYSIEGVRLSQIPVTWAVDEPDTEDKNEKCIAMTSKGEMMDVNCLDLPLRPYFCYKKKHGHTSMNECGYHDKEYQVENQTGHCYKFHETAHNWYQALTVCSAEGGKLAVLNSPVEQDFIVKMTNKRNYKGFVHLGFYKLNSNHWITFEGTTLYEAGFNLWRKGEPNKLGGHEDCGSYSISTNTRWIELNDLDCNVKTAFLCEIPSLSEQIIQV